MATTIQVTDNTHKLLKQLRRDYNVSSYDGVLQRMHEDLMHQESLAGILKHIPKQRLLRGLRDERDRF